MKSREIGEKRYRSENLEYCRLAKYLVFADGSQAGRPFVIENPKFLNQHTGVIATQIKKWMETGALELIPEASKPKPLL